MLLDDVLTQGRAFLELPQRVHAHGLFRHGRQVVLVQLQGFVVLLDRFLVVALVVQFHTLMHFDGSRIGVLGESGRGQQAEEGQGTGSHGWAGGPK